MYITGGWKFRRNTLDYGLYRVHMMVMMIRPQEGSTVGDWNNYSEMPNHVNQSEYAFVMVYHG